MIRADVRDNRLVASLGIYSINGLGFGSDG